MYKSLHESLRDKLFSVIVMYIKTLTYVSRRTNKSQVSYEPNPRNINKESEVVSSFRHSDP